MSHAWPVVLVVVLALVGSGCTSDEATPTVSPTRETTRSAEEPTATPIPLPSPRPQIPDLGVWVIDADTGTIAKLYEVQDAVLPGSVSATFGAADAVWITGEDGVARRHLFDGTSTDSVDGVTVLEGPDSSVRVLFAGDGRSLSLEVAGESEVVSDAAIRPFLSPDGSAVAYLEGSDASGYELWVATAEGASARLASDVQLCQCDDVTAPSFSPSGEFVAFSDYGALGGDDPTDRGTYVVRADGAAAPARAAAEPRALVGWLTPEEATLVLQVVSDPRLFDAATGETRPLPNQVARGTARLTQSGTHVQIWTPDGGTLLTDPFTGDALEQWSVRGTAAATPFGPAIAVNGPEINVAPIAGCWGVWIEHPNMPEAECVLGAERALWSPDASMLALLSDLGPLDRWLEFWTFGDEPIRVLVPPLSTLAGWSADGRHLLVTWGFEM